MYSPKIKEELITKMFQIKQKTGKPMTQQVDEALRVYVARFEQSKGKEVSNGRELR